MNRLIKWFVVLLFITAAKLTFAAYLFPPQLAVNILQTPTPLIAQGKDYLVYELYLTNFHPDPITLNALEINGMTTFKDEEFAKLIYPTSTKAKDPSPRTFKPGETKLVYLWLAYPNLTLVPNQLVHKINYVLHDTVHGNGDVALTLTTEPVTLSKALPIIISSPLRGDHWIAANGPSNTSDHRIAHLIIHGHDYFAQRYAIDFIKVGADGLSYSGDESKNSSYHDYGDDILAVTPGVIIDMKDGIPENVPHSNKIAVPLSYETVGGNYILENMGHGKYAFYAHLIPGSIKVKVGDKVKRGQVLAKLGNSGNSSEPHLHFHVVDKAGTLGADGVPYAFDNFYMHHSQVVSMDPYEVKITDNQLEHLINQLVLENTMIKFAE